MSKVLPFPSVARPRPVETAVETAKDLLAWHLARESMGGRRTDNLKKGAE